MIEMKNEERDVLPTEEFDHLIFELQRLRLKRELARYRNGDQGAKKNARALLDVEPKLLQHVAVDE